MKTIKFILTDIEGTTSSIHFVHKVLFPYAAKYLESFVKKNQTKTEVIAALQIVAKTAHDEDGLDLNFDEQIQKLLLWQAQDRKHTGLKLIQGLIWEQGYLSKELVSHVYPDVVEYLKKWHNEGLGLGVYSSGSVAAQKLLFKNTTYGDLTIYFSEFFDTEMGGKKEFRSYVKIAKQLDLEPKNILFLSDIEAELEAAQTARMQTILLCREELSLNTKFPIVKNFSELDLSRL